jgi:hypothetical protein
MELSTTTQRQSCMLYIKPLKSREPRTIHAPARHRAIVSSIYEQLALPVVMGDESAPSGRGLFHSGITRADGIATIEIEAIGSETAELVRQTVADLRAIHHLGAIYASLPLEDPGTPALCEAMESSGFFFSGVGPWMGHGKDTLRLQMPLTPIELSALVIVGKFGRTLLAYISSERKRCAPNSQT